MKRPWILCNNLLAAIEVNDVETVTHVIDSGFDVDTILMENKSAISVCIERGAIEIAQLFLRRGCSLSLKSQRGECPLHLAVMRGDVNIVQMLLKNRADVTSVDVLGRTALHIACERNALDIVKALLSKTAMPHLQIVDRDGRTPLIYACKYGSKDLVQCLLQKGSNVNAVDRLGESPLLECINNEQCSSEMMSHLLKAGANVHHKNMTHETPLLKALHRSYVYRIGEKTSIFQEMAIMLIDYESDLKVTNSLGQSPLHLAVCANNITLVKKLLNAGSNLDVKDSMCFVPLFYACRNANKRIVDLLINSGADLRSQDWVYAKVVLQLSDACELANTIIEKMKQVLPLSALSRTVIRKSLRNIEKQAKFLPIPASLVRYLQFNESG